MIPTESLSNFVASRSEVATRVTELFGKAVAVAGGLYTAVVAVTAPRIPHAVPVHPDNFQDTPALVGSLVTWTVNVTPALPADTAFTLLRMVTDTEPVVIEKESVSNLVLSVAEVAVIAGALAGAAGTVAGGV
jgi:hypothetical protein